MSCIVIINLDYGSSSIAPKSNIPPTVENVKISNINCTWAGTAFRLIGLEEANITRVTFRNIMAKTQKGIELTHTNYVNFKNVSLEVTEQEIINYTANKNLLFEGSNINDTDLSVALDSFNQTKIEEAGIR